jgi:hypothetical protein
MLTTVHMTPHLGRHGGLYLSSQTTREAQIGSPNPDIKQDRVSKIAKTKKDGGHGSSSRVPTKQGSIQEFKLQTSKKERKDLV